MSEFKPFGRATNAAFQRMTSDGGREVFSVAIEPDDLWARYLAAFPPGTDPPMAKKTEHDCSACRHFVRRAGGIVTLSPDGKGLNTVWDDAAESGRIGFYSAVALALRDAVRSAGVRDVFRVGARETQFGAEVTRSMDPATGRAVTWGHFWTGEIPQRFRVAMPDTERGNSRTTVQLLERGLAELSPGAVSTVMELIRSNAVYRGQEHEHAVAEFQRLQRASLALPDPARRSLHAWANASSPAARFRNTVIGTLVQDLSEGVDLERAVASFEAKVAPQNYRRTTALITPGMVKSAMATVAELGLETALERRFATVADVSVRDVRWVDNSVQPLMKGGGIADVLMRHAEASSAPASAAGDAERAEEISLDDFMATVLPGATGLEVLFAGELAGDLFSLTAPVHPEPKRLFAWGNDFAWSYAGNLTDGIKERVKAAGGKVTGVLRVSLSWSNYDDLDLHVHEPPGRGANAASEHISFRNKRGWTGGVLDVDMNAGSGRTREPVENVIWERSVPDGPYRIVVNNYALRETRDPGFTVEVECSGRVTHFSHAKGVRDKQDVAVCTLRMRDGAIESVEPGDPAVTRSAGAGRERWGLATDRYHRVTAVMLSPNHWEGAGPGVGNRHVFLVLEGARNDEDTRGFYSEFLHPRLQPHRKVFEVIADKTKCQPSEGQLSGLGFSSTKRESFLVRARMGKKTRIFSVRVNGGASPSAV